jgi:flagellar P-ring protein precursor FlgI
MLRYAHSRHLVTALSKVAADQVFASALCQTLISKKRSAFCTNWHWTRHGFRYRPLYQRAKAPVALFAVLCVVVIIGNVQAARLKDLAHIAGFRSNQLYGYGLVAGLNGTGDRQNTEFTVQTLTNLLQEHNIRVSPEDVRVKNVAAVIVTAEVPAFAQPGTRLDATISSAGDASSLSGGVLLLAPLKGPDGKVYAVAQGAVSLGGGFTAQGVGAKVTKNHQTAGRITAGVLLEREVPSTIVNHDGKIRINLDKPDFTTAKRISEAINYSNLKVTAKPVSPGVISVNVPSAYKSNPVDFVSALESVEIAPDQPARIVINERTGTVIINRDVRIAPVAVAHAGLHIAIKTEQRVSQPNSFARGDTRVVPDTQVIVKEPDTRQLVQLPGGPGASLNDIVQALNALGVTPRDLIVVFEALREAGALQAELILM